MTCLPVADVDLVFVEVVVEFCAHIRRNLCPQDEPGPENKTGQSIIRQNYIISHWKFKTRILNPKHHKN